MKIFSGPNALVMHILGGTFCMAAHSACSAPGSSNSESNSSPNASNGSPELSGVDRSSIHEILPGADRLRDLTVLQLGTPAQRRVKFNSLGNDFSLRVERNWALFAPDLVVERDGVKMTREQAGLEPPFRGFVEGDPKSWVRVRFRDELVEGLVFTQGELYEVRPSQENPHELTMARGAITDYLEHPSGLDGDVHCGVVGEAAPEVPGTLASPAPQACQWIGIHMISDYTHVARLGGTAQAEAEMAARMNETDGMYRADLAYGFRVEAVTSHSVQGTGYNAPNLTINAQLTALSTWKGTSDAARGVVQVHAARVSSGAVGLAWVGALCSAKNASSVTNYLGTGRGTTICSAHELGHNFGSSHDASGAAFIMAPSVNANVTTFSATSKTAIRNHVGSVSCFSPCGTAGTAGTGGTGGAGGAAGKGGSAGTSGTGGVAGTGGAGGMAGKAGSGGVAGTAGAGGVAGTSGMAGTGGGAGVSGGAGTGGVPGTDGGAGSAGKGGAAGASGTSGSAGSAGVGATGGSGGNAGAVIGAGGSLAGRSGSGGAGGGVSAGAGGTKSQVTAPEPGCGCRVVAPQDMQSGGAFGGLIAAFAASLRRRARRKSASSPT